VHKKVCRSGGMADTCDSKSHVARREGSSPSSGTKVEKVKEKVIVVCGPTATGKSDYAVTLAKKINGEIISADSRQIYKGLDIGTGKITKKEMRGVPHYMLDIADPRRQFTVSRYRKIADKTIRTIIKKGKVPIVCGGTGFYIDVLLRLDLPEVKPNSALRRKLEKESTEKLYKVLVQKDPERAESIDRHNRVRLIRALEIIAALGKVPKIQYESGYDVEWIGLSCPDEVLRRRIHDRLIKRVKKGMIKEAEKLHQKGLSWKRMEDLGLEYRYLTHYLQGKLTKKQMLEQLETAIWQYARRQKTWFRKNKEINWKS
jgi:tRNA dimethylallyltransferase